MNIFVTGGAGFIGSFLSSELLKDGHSITIFDNFRNSSKNKISSLLNHGIKLIDGDIMNVHKLESSLSNIDLVIHLAAQIDINDSISNPENTFSINEQGTRNILDACIKNNVKNIIAASSAAIFGHPKKLPLDENSPINPISPYGSSKARMEKLIQEYSLLHDFNGISLRFFNIYGKGQSRTYGGVITKFLECIQNNKSLIIYGDETITRDFIHIQDVISAIKCAIKHLEGKRGNCYNIATGKSTNLKQLAKLMLLISGKNLELKFKPVREGDILKSETSIELAETQLDFHPKISLEDGLHEMFRK